MRYDGVRVTDGVGEGREFVTEIRDACDWNSD
jgi:hypothetical protein